MLELLTVIAVLVVGVIVVALCIAPIILGMSALVIILVALLKK